MKIITGLFISALGVAALYMLMWGMVGSSDLLKAGVCAVIFAITLFLPSDLESRAASSIQSISMAGAVIYLFTWLLTGGQA